MTGNFLHRMNLWARAIFCFSCALALCGFVFLFFPQQPFPESPDSSPLLFEKPDFNPPLSEDPEEEPQANQGYRIEHTSRGLMRFKTETAGSPGFGTPVPEILPYDPRSKLPR